MMLAAAILIGRRHDTLLRFAMPRHYATLRLLPLFRRRCRFTLFMPATLRARDICCYAVY